MKTIVLKTIFSAFLLAGLMCLASIAWAQNPDSTQIIQEPDSLVTPAQSEDSLAVEQPADTSQVSESEVFFPDEEAWQPSFKSVQPDSALENAGEDTSQAVQSEDTLLAAIESEIILPPVDTLDYFGEIVHYADSLLSYDKRLILEGKILALDLYELSKLKSKIDKRDDLDLLMRYYELSERFTRLLSKVELAMLTTFSEEDWANLRADYESEMEEGREHIEALTDSLVLVYTPIFASEKGKSLLAKVEEQDVLLQDFYYRMGVLHLEQAEYRYERDFAAWDELVDSLSFYDVEMPPEPKLDYSLAVVRFTTLLDSFPQSEYNDDALYNLAYIKSRSADPDVKYEGVLLLHEFTRKYPESSYYPEVEMRLGEYYFNLPESEGVDRNESIAQAVTHYQTLLNYPEEVQYGNAMYRLGWAYYLQDEYELAIEYFTRTVDETMERMRKGSYSNLLEESIENLSKSYVTDTTGVYAGISSAVEFLKDDPKRLELFGDQMIKRIGDIYQNDMADYHHAIQAYDTLLAFFPNDPEAPNIQRQKIKCYQQLKDTEKVLDEKFALFVMFNHTSEWASAQDDSANVKQADLLAEKNLREVIRQWIDLATSSNDPEDLEKTVKYCRDYVKYYPITTKTYSIHYNLATILTRYLNDYQQGLQENIRVTRRYAAGEYHKTCADNAVACAFKLKEMEKTGEITLDTLDIAALEIPAEVIEQIPYLGNNPLTNSEKLCLITVQNYIDLFPQGEQADTYLLNAGIIYYSLERYADSRYYLEKLKNEFPYSPHREEACRTILQGYFVSKDFELAEEFSKEILQGNYSPELKELAQARIGESIYLKGKEFEENGEFLRAGSEYKRVAMESPRHEFADDALWESGRQFMNAAKLDTIGVSAAWDSAIVSFDLLATRYDTSQWAAKALNNIGFIQQDNQDERLGAAYTFERLFDTFPDSSVSRSALIHASVNYTEVDSFYAALRVNEKYLRKFSGDKEDKNIIVILYENAELYLKMGNLTQAVNKFNDFTRMFPDDPRNVRAEYQIGKYYLDSGDKVRAEISFKRAVEVHDKLVAIGETGFPRYASYALYKLLEWKFIEYVGIEYKPLNAVAANRARKEALKKELEEGFKELISYRQKEALQALFNICRLSEELAWAELNQAVSQVSIDQLLIQREEILGKSLPLYIDAAISYYTVQRELAEWLEALSQQKKEITAHISFLDSLKMAQGFLEADSQTALEVKKDDLEEVENSLTIAETLQDSCRYEIAKIYLNDARYVADLLQGFIDIPDQFEDRKKKMIFRATILGQAVFPRVQNILSLYRQAYVVADTINASTAWKDTSMAEGEDIFLRSVDEYYQLIERPMTRYRVNLGAVRQRVQDDDYSAYDVMPYLTLYLSFGKAFIDSMMVNTGAVLDLVHSDTTGIGFTEKIDSIYTYSIWKYYQQFSDIRETNQKYYDDYMRKFENTGYDLYFDGANLFESIMDYTKDYQYDILVKADEYIETYAIVNKTGDRLLRELVKRDPVTYGYLLGIRLDQGVTVVGGTDWKVEYEATREFRELGFNDSKWESAVIIEPLQPAEAVIDTGAAEQVIPQDSTIVVPDSSQQAPADTSEFINPNPQDPSQFVDDDSSYSIEAEDSTAIDTVYKAEEALPDTAIVVEEEQVEAGPDMTALLEMGAQPIAASEPAQKTYFRRKVVIDGVPIAGLVTITADNKFALFVNEQFVGEGGGEGDEWLTPTNFSVKTFLLQGENIIAIEVEDPDLTNNGLWFKLQYNIMPENIDELPIIRE